jgi:hypothetical protein
MYIPGKFNVHMDVFLGLIKNMHRIKENVDSRNVKSGFTVCGLAEFHGILNIAFVSVLPPPPILPLFLTQNVWGGHYAYCFCKGFSVLDNKNYETSRTVEWSLVKF